MSILFNPIKPWARMSHAVSQICTWPAARPLLPHGPGLLLVCSASHCGLLRLRRTAAWLPAVAVGGWSCGGVEWGPGGWSRRLPQCRRPLRWGTRSRGMGIRVGSRLGASTVGSRMKGVGGAVSLWWARNFTWAKWPRLLKFRVCKHFGFFSGSIRFGVKTEAETEDWSTQN
jgi:hypothetical protein